MSFRLGSLFDGSGGFPLAGNLCGIEPVWASEVEPYPIAVTRSRFHNMLHLGDITKVNGAEIEPVDIITFGSPCQDLSVAGKRAGLKHEDNGDDETTRSGLFMDSVRIIKEMREATNGAYPRFALWENVHGAYSSNKGEDFRIVLEELIKIVEPTAKVPAADQNKWSYADVYVGDGWSLAYRTFDAQYWGVPQRRRRIHLVADFGGECAGKVLFEREGLRGHSEESRTPWQEATADAERCVDADDRERNCLIAVATQQGGAEISENGVCPTITAAAGMSGNNQPWICKVYDAQGNARDNQMAVAHMVLDDQGGSQINIRTDGKAPTIRAEMHGNVPCVMEAAGFDGYNQAVTGNVSKGLTAIKSDADHVPIVFTSVYCLQGNGIDRADTAGCNGKGVKEDTAYTLNTIDRHAVAYWDGSQTCGTLTANNAGGNQRMPDKENFNCVIEKVEEPIVLDRAFYNQGKNAQYDPQFYQDGTVPTLVAKGPSAVCQKQKVRYIVRRLTPTECARLQGFPDKWGHPDPKADFSDEEYRFWHNVRNTDERIKGKKVGTYSKDQMLKWYNKLHTDSAEYKMWGNGIALPPALYVMQGIAEVLERRCKQ